MDQQFTGANYSTAHTCLNLRTKVHSKEFNFSLRATCKNNNDVDFGEELRQLTRPKSLQELKGELDYEDWVFTAQRKLEKAGLWHIINTQLSGPAGAAPVKVV